MARQIFRVGLALSASLLLSVAGAPAWAAPVPIGRASTETPADQRWQVLTLPHKARAAASGTHEPAKVARTVAVLASGRSIYALLLFEGSVAVDASRRQWKASCEDHKTSKGMFVRNRWLELPGESRDDCLVAIGPIDLNTALKALDAQTAAVVENSRLGFDATGYAIQATVAQDGRYLSAWLLAHHSFKGSDVPLAIGLGEARLPPSVVQWGVELAGAVRAGVVSPSRKFELPRIDFLESANRVPVHDASPIPPLVLTPPPDPVQSQTALALCPNFQQVVQSARYPTDAHAALLKEGKVLVDFTLTADGEVTDVSAIRASDEVFVAEAVATVKRLKCNRQSRNIRVRVPFGFRLEAQRP